MFTISKVKHTKPVTYTIKNTKEEEIQGTFYEPEIQKTTQEIYRMVWKNRTRRNDIKEVYVKWKGYLIRGLLLQIYNNEHPSNMGN